ncbi:hypothetical protein BDV98DRAFT_530488 [Pterulicium gracile]|uniref:Uncharacterized protein n=1 Tax=Pterulicium gracile TaxID=1884261 RepID=A0A5C3QH81_9AGAR|nr:hypothetical protein BDV98DRAFT_530488 [Pterula gracilis]
MRLLSLLSVAAAVVSATAAATIEGATPTGTSTIEIQHLTDGCEAAEIPCEVLAAAEIADQSPAPEVIPRHLSNAQRLARRLPLKAPHRRSAHRRHEDLPAPAGPSTVPEPTNTFRGVIQAVNADTGVVVGYLSRSSFSGAQYRYQDLASAMIVSFKMPLGSIKGERMEVVSENSDITMFEYLSLVQGRDNTDGNLAEGSFHYAYLSASESTPAGSPGQSVGNGYTSATNTARLAQSSVWFYDANTGDFEPQWINLDGSIAPTTVFTQSTALYVGGDVGAFVSRYPSPVTKLVFKFVPL